METTEQIGGIASKARHRITNPLKGIGPLDLRGLGNVTQTSDFVTAVSPDPADVI